MSIYELKSFITFTRSVVNIYNNKKKQEFLNNIIAELLEKKKVTLIYSELEVIMGDANLIGEKLAKLFNEMETRIDNHNLQQRAKRGRLTELDTMSEKSFGPNVDGSSSGAKATTAIPISPHEGEKEPKKQRGSSTLIPK